MASLMKVKKSFTLIELIVVIAIIAILAAIIAPNAFKAIEKAKAAKTVADLKAIKTAIQTLYADTGKFPLGCPAFSNSNPDVSIQGSTVGIVSKPPVGVTSNPGDSVLCEWVQADVDSWDGPYIDSGHATDVWQQPYIFDPDYCFCQNLPPDGCCAGSEQAASCLNSNAYQECERACAVGYPDWLNTHSCIPPVLKSNGPDRKVYTCDDIIVQLTLN